MRSTTKPRGRGRNVPGGVGPGGISYLGNNKPAPGAPPAPSTNGGTTAPGGGQGQGAPKPGGRGRGGSGQGAGQGGQGQAPGIGGGGMAGPGGAQLSRRVASGKITQEQADRTMKQRQTLQKAFGKDWRSKISSGGQSFAQVNQGLAKNPGNAKLVALRKKLAEGRTKALEAAKSKVPPKGKKKGTPAEEGE